MDNRRSVNRTRILDHAESLIRRFSFSGLRLADLSRSAGMSRKTLYNHFPGGKREIWLRVIERRRQSFTDRLVGLTEDTGSDYVERARLILDIGKDAMDTFFGPGGLIPSDEDEELFFPDLKNLYMEAIHRFLQEGTRLGFLRSGLPLKSLAGVLVTLISEWHRDSSLMKGGECLLLPEFVEQVILGGILAPRGRRNLHRLVRSKNT